MESTKAQARTESYIAQELLAMNNFMKGYEKACSDNNARCGFVSNPFSGLATVRVIRDGKSEDYVLAHDPDRKTFVSIDGTLPFDKGQN
jgi:hypothetical protein